MTNEQLVLLIKDGIDVPDNMLQLWQQNRAFIGKIACSYKGYEEMDDLKQQGYIGLCQAVEGYKPGEEVPFINYAAFWIRQSMVRYIENCGSIVRIPSHEKQRQKKYKRIVSDFKARTGREPTDQEISRCMEISCKVLQEMKNNTSMGQIGSLDDHVGEDGDTAIGEMIPGNANVERDVLDRVESEELRVVLWEMVDSLPDKQPEVIRAVYQEGRTLKEVGETIGVTMSRAGQLRQGALRELRKPGRIKRLIAFLPEKVECLAYRHNGVTEFNRTWTSSTELAALKVYEEITGHVLH